MVNWKELENLPVTLKSDGTKIIYTGPITLTFHKYALNNTVFYRVTKPEQVKSKIQFVALVLPDGGNRIDIGVGLTSFEQTLVFATLPQEELGNVWHNMQFTLMGTDASFLFGDIVKYVLQNIDALDNHGPDSSSDVLDASATPTMIATFFGMYEERRKLITHKMEGISETPEQKKANAVSTRRKKTMQLKVGENVVFMIRRQGDNSNKDLGTYEGTVRLRQVASDTACNGVTGCSVIAYRLKYISMSAFNSADSTAFKKAISPVTNKSIFHWLIVGSKPGDTKLADMYSTAFIVSEYADPTKVIFSSELLVKELRRAELQAPFYAALVNIDSIKLSADATAEQNRNNEWTEQQQSMDTKRKEFDKLLTADQKLLDQTDFDNDDEYESKNAEEDDNTNVVDEDDDVALQEKMQQLRRQNLIEERMGQRELDKAERARASARLDKEREITDALERKNKLVREGTFQREKARNTRIDNRYGQMADELRNGAKRADTKVAYTPDRATLKDDAELRQRKALAERENAKIATKYGLKDVAGNTNAVKRDLISGARDAFASRPSSSTAPAFGRKPMSSKTTKRKKTGTAKSKRKATSMKKPKSKRKSSRKH